MSNETIREIFARNLAKAMFDKDIKPADLSKSTGISERTIWRYLSCKTEPKISDLENIALALDIPRLSLII